MQNLIPPAVDGRDVLGCAQTGTGKTAAFALPILHRLTNDNPPSSGRARVLVLMPTRELAIQIDESFHSYGQQLRSSHTVIYGGVGQRPQVRAMARGVDVLSATPGRLLDLIGQGHVHLDEVGIFILDEADRMLDMGFIHDVRRIIERLPSQRQTLLFSATIPKPIEALARRYQSDALRITTVGKDRGHGDISYQAVVVSPPEVENAVVNLLRYHEAETAILFCGTREKVRHLHATLQERGFAVVALSGENSQSERNQALQALRDRRARVCVATDVAARGIDLPTLSLVIHVEIPRDAEALQHRSGRTGRAGRKGTAVLVVPFSRRRRVEAMLRNAKIDAKWTDAPDRDAIRAKDRERLLKALLEPVETDEADSDLVDSLLEQRSARELAAMLVSAHRAKLPEPEDLIANTPEAHRAAKAERHRPGFEETAWFRMDIGRRRNADPRWILPLLCRRGHITRNEVGAIRIGPNETYFQIPRAIADKFADAVNRTAGDGEDGEDIRIEASATGPRDAARTNRKAHPGAHRDGKPKPHRKNFGGKPKGDFKGNRPNKPHKGAKKKDR